MEKDIKILSEEDDEFLEDVDSLDLDG